MLNYFKMWAKGRKGQGLVEYALIIVLIAIVVFAAVELLGGEVKDIFTDITTKLTT